MTRAVTDQAEVAELRELRAAIAAEFKNLRIELANLTQRVERIDDALRDVLPRPT